jgi:LuxR family transcriptional regulator, quorum-sensing system regulator BjaR1
MLEQTAFETIDKLRMTKSHAEVKVVFDETARAFGASAFMICDIPPDAPPGARDIHASGWNQEWEQRYIREGYAADDPVPNSVSVRTNPYYWKEAEKIYSENLRSVKIMNEARSEFHMLGGYCVPIHGLRGVAGVVSIATDQLNWQLSEHEDAALHLISIYAYEAVRRVRKPVDSTGGPQLTRREIDCLQWIAEGKTTWEIGTILSISEHTVGEYVGNAARKLGTFSRAHLVARALRQNLIK